PTTKRTNSEIGLTSRVNAQVRAVAAATLVAPRSSSPSCAIASIVGPTPSGLGLCRLFSHFFSGRRSELGFRNPAGLHASLHDHRLGVLARNAQTIEKAWLVLGLAVLALGPAGQIIGGAAGQI